MAGRTPDATVCYKTLKSDSQSVPVLFDAYLPASLKSENAPIPAVIYFHGGGMTVGNRQAWFPKWLYERVIALGYVFISADYQLLPAATGHDIVEDVKHLFNFLSDTEIKSGSGTIVKIDISRVAVTGSSAGGLCAYLASIHCSPRPKALVSLYGMGGDFLTRHYLEFKTQIFDRKRELLDPADFKEYTYPFEEGSLGRITVTDSPLAFHPPTYRIPGYPANPRQLLCRLIIQVGSFLDYWTGVYEPSLSARLMNALVATEGEGRDQAVEALASLIPDEHRSIFPQLSVNSKWPSTLILHGTADSAVPLGESLNMKRLLQEAGVPVELLTCEGMEHSFDYNPKAEEVFAADFNQVKVFLETHLGR